MKKIFCKFLMSCFVFAFLTSKAQQKFLITGFSDRYEGQLEIAKGFEEEVFKKGRISIIEIETKKKLFTIESDELTYDLDEGGKVKTNVSEIPYGEQSIIISGDFNFDGRPDLAVMDGQNSCYHGPSFQIYLETGKGLLHSEGFTRLAQEYCGIFSVNEDEKTISTITKSGCCWHEFSEFKVEDNIPVATKIYEEGINENGYTAHIVESELVNGKMREKAYDVLVEDERLEEIYSIIFAKGKEASVYRTNDEDHPQLIYVFRDVEDHVELFYNDRFIYDPNKNILQFTNEGVTYEIGENTILVKMKEKNVRMNSVVDTSQTLRSAGDLKLKNVTIR